MDVRPLEREADYDWALAEIEPYFEHEPAPGTPDAARFSVLATLIGAYEDRHWPIEAPTALAGLRAAMELTGRSQADLATLLGSRSRASELLNGVRVITMDQARVLHAEWDIPAELLLRPAREVA